MTDTELAYAALATRNYKSGVVASAFVHGFLAGLHNQPRAPYGGPERRKAYEAGYEAGFDADIERQAAE